MRLFTPIVCFCLTLLSCTVSKTDYLKQHRYDLRDDAFSFSLDGAHVVGYGAYHGSQKTDEVEVKLLAQVMQQSTSLLYILETDFSTALRFNEYLKTGDEKLLKELVYYSNDITKQDRTISCFHKWKAIKALNDEMPQDQKLKVLGLDIITNYKMTIHHLLKLLPENLAHTSLTRLKKLYKKEGANFSARQETEVKKAMRTFVQAYDKDKSLFIQGVRDAAIVTHLLHTIKRSLERLELSRDAVIFDNYKRLDSMYDFRKNPQFARYGFFHIEKQREGTQASFFTYIIESGMLKRDEVVTVLGYLTASEVLWDQTYDEHGNYTGYTIEGGYGIGDYEKEYFRGIHHLKAAKIADLTLFKLHAPDSPYRDGYPDLIEIVMKDEPSNGAAVKGKSTTEFLDYAVLISNSAASIPIEEMED